MMAAVESLQRAPVATGHLERLGRPGCPGRLEEEETCKEKGRTHACLHESAQYTVSGSRCSCLGEHHLLPHDPAIA